MRKLACIFGVSAMALVVAPSMAAAATPEGTCANDVAGDYVEFGPCVERSACLAIGTPQENVNTHWCPPADDQTS